LTGVKAANCLSEATKKHKLAAAAPQTIGAGFTAAQGGFFCYFSCPSRKVKDKNPQNLRGN